MLSYLRLFMLIALALFSASLAVAAEPDPSPPYTMEKIQRWQKSMEPWPWHFLPQQEVSLRGKDKQLLEAISGGSRSGEYILFAKTTKGWKPISDIIEQSHHPLHPLPRTVNGWHDFQSFSPLWGSGGKEVWVSTYRWKAGKYVLLRQQDGKFCDFEPFKNNKDECTR